jgi:hypothetical protein
MAEDALRALPRDAPNFHRRQASHLRALAATTTTPAIKNRLIDQAEQHDNLAEIAGEPELEELAAEP